jgi:hypothetical protein
MPRMLKAVIVVAALLIAVPLAVYAVDYAGEYELTLTFDVVSPSYADAEVRGFNASWEEMQPLSFYDVLLKGRGGTTLCNFTVLVAVMQGTDVQTQTENALVFYPISDAGTAHFDFRFFELQPGETGITIYIEHVYTDAVVYENTWTVNIG